MRAFLKSVMGALICASLLVEEVMPAAYAKEAGVPDAAAISADVDAAAMKPVSSGTAAPVMKVLDENGALITEDDPGYKEVLKTYDAYFSQLNGRVFDASGMDMTDFVIEQIGGSKRTEGEDRTDESTDNNTDRLSDNNTDSPSEIDADHAEELFSEQSSDPRSVQPSELRTPMISGGVTTWDCIWFGSRTNEKNNAATGSVKWRVLDIVDGKALLMSDETLNNYMYNITTRDKNYKNSLIRRALKNNLTPGLFTAKELSIVVSNEYGDAVGLPTLAILNDEKYGFTDATSLKADSEYWIGDLQNGNNVYVDKNGEIKEAPYVKGSIFGAESATQKGARAVISVDLAAMGEIGYAGTVTSAGVSEVVRPAGDRTITLSAGTNATVDGKSSVSLDIFNNRISAEELPEAVWNKTGDKKADSYDFDGWYDREQDGRRYVAGSVVPEEVDTLYARFRKSLSPENDISLGEGQKIHVELPSGDIPFLSDDLSFDFAGLYTSFYYDRVEGTYEVGIGIDLAAVKQNVDDRGVSLEKYFGGELRDVAENFQKAMEAFNSAKMASAAPMKVGAEIEPSFTIMGYVEGTYNEEDGLSAPTIGRVCISFEVYYDGQWQTAIAFIPIAIRIRFGAGGTITLEIEKTEDGSDFNFSGDAEFILPGIELRAGVGLAKVASIGIYGAAESVVHMRLDSEGFSGEWKLRGEAGGYVTVLWFDYKKSFIKGEIKITDWGPDGRNKDEDEDRFSGAENNLYDGGEYVPARTYEDVISDWNEEALFCEGEDEGRNVLLKNMYNMPAPKAVQTKDGTAVLVFTGANDKEAADDGNYTSVYYKTFDAADPNAGGSAPAHIDSGEHAAAEFEPALATDGSDIWAVWMDACAPVSAMQAGVLNGISGDTLSEDQKSVLGDLMKGVDIRVAKYDKATGQFGDYETLNNEGKLDSNPVIAAVNDELHIVWLQDDTPAVSMNEGKDTGTEVIKHVYKSKTAGAWTYEDIVTSGASVSWLSVGQLGNDAVLAYCADKDRDFSTTDDVELYAKKLSGTVSGGAEAKLLASAGKCPANPQFACVDGNKTPVLIWSEKDEQDTVIRYAKSLDGGLMKLHINDSSALSPDFVLMDSDDLDLGEGEEYSVLITRSGDDRYSDEAAEKAADKKVWVYFIDKADDDEQYAGDEEYDAGFPIELEDTGISGDVSSVAGFWKPDHIGANGSLEDLILIYTEGAASFDSDGSFDLSTNMYMDSLLDNFDIMFADEDGEIDVDPRDIRIGEKGVTLDFTVINASFDDMKKIRAVVRDSDKNILYNGVIDLAAQGNGSLEPGDPGECSIVLDVGKNTFKKADKLSMHIMSEQSAYFNLNDGQIAAGKDLEDADEKNYVRFNVGDVELSLDQNVTADDTGMGVTYRIINECIFDTRVKFALFARDENGNERLIFDEDGVRSEEILEVKAGGSEEIVLDDSVLDEITSYGDVIFTKVTNLNDDGTENNAIEAYVGDNTEMFSVNHCFIEEVTANKSTLELMPGQSETLTAIVAPEEMSDIGVYWFSTDESVARVDAAGKVTAVACGVADIIATANDGGAAKTAIRVAVGAGSLVAKGDTHALTPVTDSKGRITSYKLELSEDVTSAVITVVKGNKFKIANGVKNSFRFENKKKGKKYLSVSKKGSISAKKNTPQSGMAITYTDSRTGNKVRLTVRVLKQTFEGKTGLTASVKKGLVFDLKAGILMNAEFRTDKIKNRSAIPDLSIQKGDDFAWYISGTPVKKNKTVKIPFYIYGKKMYVTIKTKKGG
ncbi:MAG: Ig-like domain-containing protein [Lachnospiraceae bacterium]|nr:Ig-like domain-containing protein [Lachnospiraceae bacterium]